MKPKTSIYLAGSIQKGHEQNDTYWSEKDISTLKNSLSMFEVTFLNPAIRGDNLGDQRSVFGRDMLQVFSSDFVFVDARDRRGLGVGAEMMWAKFHKIPIITWAPKNSHYHKSSTTVLGVSVNDFVHPFIENLSDKIVENLIEGAKWIQHVKNSHDVEIKGIESIRSAMHYYEDNQLDQDLPMKEFLTNGSPRKKLNHFKEAIASLL